MYIVEKGDVGKRIDKYLSEKLNISRNRVALSQVFSNDKLVKPSYKVCENDKITYEIKEDEPIVITKEDKKLDIVYEDEYLAIINKPYNMVVHPCSSFRENTLVNALLSNFKSLSNVDPLRPGIVHRLDKDTSGILIIAKTNACHEKLVQMFKNHEIHKTYLAILKGKLNKDRVEVRTYIGRSKKDRKKMSSNTDNGKLAISIFKLIKENDLYSYVKVEILTGRTHQIRVHAKELNHPILGDHVYGRNDKFNRQQLHAYSVEFIHPFTNKKMKFSVDIPHDMKETLEKVKLC